MQVLIFVANLISVVLMVLQFVMLARVILSWVTIMADGAGGGIYGFLVWITEPVVWPMRRLFDRFGWGADLPIDLPLFATFMALSLISIFI